MALSQNWTANDISLIEYDEEKIEVVTTTTNELAFQLRKSYPSPDNLAELTTTLFTHSDPSVQNLSVLNDNSEGNYASWANQALPLVINLGSVRTLREIILKGFSSTWLRVRVSEDQSNWDWIHNSDSANALYSLGSDFIAGTDVLNNSAELTLDGQSKEARYIEIYGGVNDYNLIELGEVEVYEYLYWMDDPDIVFNTPVNGNILTNLTESKVITGSDYTIQYQISLDDYRKFWDGTIFQSFTEEFWQSILKARGHYDKTNTILDLTTNWSSLTTNLPAFRKIKLHAFLHSEDGEDSPGLISLDLAYDRDESHLATEQPKKVYARFANHSEPLRSKTVTIKPFDLRPNGVVHKWTAQTMLVSDRITVKTNGDGYIVVDLIPGGYTVHLEGKEMFKIALRDTDTAVVNMEDLVLG